LELFAHIPGCETGHRREMIDTQSHRWWKKTEDGANLMNTILIVEDDRFVTQFVSDLLSENGYAIRTASNGFEALDALREATPDLILLDILMPRMDGFQFLEILQQNQLHRNIPVVVLSAKCQLSERVKMLEAGADDFLSKPFDEEELLARIRTRLNKHVKLTSRRILALDSRIEGDLAMMPIVDLIQVLRLHRETGEILLQFESCGAVIHLNEGNLVNVQFGRLQGIRAFYRLLDRNRGTFVFSRSPGEFKVHITKETQQFIMDAIRLSDECRRILADLPPIGSVLIRTRNLAENTLPYEILKVLLLVDGRATIDEILLNSDADDHHTLEVIKNLIDRGMIVNSGIVRENQSIV
jgi:CheY-like chemotaxis protein